MDAKELHIDIETYQGNVEGKVILTAFSDGKEITIIDASRFKQFFSRPGISIKGICQEAGVSYENVTRILKAEGVPSRKTMASLLPIMKLYGFK